MPTFSPGFLDELRARLPLHGLIGRRMRLARSGRQWKGCCPFHGEKTPSFYVYDDHFHCFGCGAHGDAISFTMQMDGAGFPEAVASLAAEAGLALPVDDDPAGDGRRARNDAIVAALDAATALFARSLAEAPDAAPARAYLAGRGIGDDAVAAWRLGWSGTGALRPALRRAGHEDAILLAAGLLTADEDGAIRGEMFRNRIMFPISDRRGHPCGFGGRVLGDGQPKYLNGPETVVFSKRRSLYGLDRARSRRRRGNGNAASPPPPLVLAEGYMDVIALDAAGLAAAAPLGTALGEEQLAEAWRLDPSPVLCLDGDVAGRRAAKRAVERALPLLTHERTLRICFLEAGEDPDSVLRRHGADALARRVNAALPLSEAVYALLDPPEADASPEARAAFLARLDEAAASIADKPLAAEYRRALRDRFFASRGPVAAGRGGAGRGRAGTAGRDARGGTGRGGEGRHPGAGAARPTLSDGAAREEQAAHLAIIAARNPSLLHDVEDAWARLELPAWLGELREGILATGSDLLDSDGVVDHLRSSGQEHLLLRAEQLVRRTGGLDRSGRPGAMPAAAEAGWWHFFGLIQHAKLDDEIRMARSLLERDVTDARQARLIALVEARAKILQVENDG